MYCGQCGTALDVQARFCGVCGAPRPQSLPSRRKSGTQLVWIIGGAVVALTAVATGIGFVTSTSVTATPSPIPVAVLERNLVSLYYREVSSHKLKEAYHLLSPRLRQNLDYLTWMHTYDATVEASASNMSASNGSVAFMLIERDKTDAGVLNGLSNGTWHFVHGSGKLFLDDPHVALLYSSYFLPGRLGNGTAAETYGKLKQSLAFIATRTANGIGFGTAFCIGSDESDSYFLTNSHVVPDSADLVLLVPMNAGSSSNPVDATVMFRDSRRDVAIVQAHVPRVPVVIFASKAPSEGQSIAIAGFPDVQIRLFFARMGLTPSMHLGSVNAITGNGSLVEFDATTDHGNSGGPLFDPSTGAVYGLVTYVVPSQQSVAVQNNFAISVQELWPFISSSKVRVLRADSP